MDMTDTLQSNQICDGTDTWVLRKRAAYRRITEVAELLFEKLVMEFSDDDLREILLNLRKEDRTMSLYRQKRSRYWYLNISVDGKRFRQSTRCEGRREAAKVRFLLLKRLLEAVDPKGSSGNTGSPSPSTGTCPTFREASEQYLRDMCRGKKISWQREELCHKDLVRVFGDRKIDQITPAEVLAWREQELKRVVKGGHQISARSVNYTLGYLKRLSKYAVDIQGWLTTNPACKIKPLSLPRKTGSVLDEKDEAKLLAACGYPWLRRVVTFAIESGLRISEVAGLKRTDFHLDYGIPHFKVVRAKNRVITEFPLASERLITVIHDQVSTGSAGEFFFTDDQGGPLNRFRIADHLNRAVRKAGIAKISANGFRRTFCSRLNWLGCNKMFVEALMGHTVKGVEQHYLVNSLQHMYEELKRIEEKKKNSVIHLSYMEKNQSVPTAA